MAAGGGAGPLLLIAADVLLLGLLLAALLFLLGRGLRALRRREDLAEELPVRRCVVCGVGWRAPTSRRLSWVGAWARRRIRRTATRLDRDPPSWATIPSWNRCPSCLSTRVRLSRLSGPEHEQALAAEAAAVRARAGRGGRLGKVAVVLGLGLVIVGVGARLLTSS